MLGLRPGNDGRAGGFESIWTTMVDAHKVESRQQWLKNLIKIIRRNDVLVILKVTR